MVGLEAPSVETYRDIISERIVAGEIEVDHPRQPVAEEEHVVRKEIRMDHALRQAARPVTLECGEFLLDQIAQRALHLVDAIAAMPEQRPPAVDRERVSPLACEIEAGEMELRQRLAQSGAMDRARPPNPQAVEERDDGRRAAGDLAERLALLVLDRQRTGDPATGEVLH